MAIVVNRSGFLVNNVTPVRELSLMGIELVNKAINLLEVRDKYNTYICNKVYEAAITNEGVVVSKQRIKVLEFWVLNQERRLIDTAKVLIA